MCVPASLAVVINHVHCKQEVPRSILGRVMSSMHLWILFSRFKVHIFLLLERCKVLRIEIFGGFLGD
jgi:hypothetical protein